MFRTRCSPSRLYQDNFCRILCSWPLVHIRVSAWASGYVSLNVWFTRSWLGLVPQSGGFFVESTQPYPSPMPSSTMVNHLPMLTISRSRSASQPSISMKLDKSVAGIATALRGFRAAIILRHIPSWPLSRSPLPTLLSNISNGSENATLLNRAKSSPDSRGNL